MLIDPHSTEKFKEVIKQLLIYAVACLPTFWFMYSYLNIPTKIFSIITFMALLFMVVLTYVFNKRVEVNLNLNALTTKLLFIALYTACLMAVFLIPASNESVVSDLSSFTPLNWFRTAAGLALSIFLPGYAILSWFKHKLGLILFSLSSFLLSIFINSVITFIAVALDQSALSWILLANTIVVAISVVHAISGKARIESLNQPQGMMKKLENEHVMLIILCIFELSILLSVFTLSSFAVPNGDMWDHVAMATRLEKNEFLRFGYLTYPPFFAVHLLSASQLTGISVISVSNVLGLTNTLAILAFYVLAQVATHKKAVAFLSTLAFTLFGSFTFLVQALLGTLTTETQQLSTSFMQVSGKTMQIQSIYPLANMYAYAPVTLTLISVIILTALSIQKEKSTIVYPVETVLIANLFLQHVAETLYVLIFILAALVLNFSRTKDLLSLTIGMWIGEGILLTLPFTESSISLYLAIIYTIALGLVLLNSKVKLVERTRNLKWKTLTVLSKKTFKTILATAILSIYSLLLFVWYIIYIYENKNIASTISYLGEAPTYFLPIVFGITAIISVVYLVTNLMGKQLLDNDELKVIAFLIIASTFAFCLGKGITVMNIAGQEIYRELRIVQVFGGILFSIITGYALCKVINHFKENRKNQKHILAIVLGLIILFGSGSTFLSATFWSNNGIGAYSLNSNEIQAIDFLKNKVSASDVILTYNQESNKKVGLTGATTINRFSVPFSSASPSIPKDFLQIVNYIYLTKEDCAAIQRSDTYMKSLLSVLPIVFENPEVTIYSVSLFRNAISNSHVSVVIIGEQRDALPKLAILDSFGLSYRIYDQWDMAVLENNGTIILTDDVKNASDAAKYLNWVHNGGNLFVLGNGGYFSNFMNIRAKTKISFQETFKSEEWSTNWTLDLRYGLSMGNISISSEGSDQEFSSLQVNATFGGAFGLSHPRNGQRTFPFSIGGWFMIAENKSTIVNSLILSDSLSAGVGLWDGNFGLDYYYDGGKIIPDIANISLGDWQKIELYFPDTKTCDVYLNDTLIFVGPRSTRYDSSDSTYMNEQNNTIYTYFTGRFLSFWKGLYYTIPEQLEANGLLFKDTPLNLDFEFNITSPKECSDKNVQIVAWYTFQGQETAPIVFANQFGYGKIGYIDFNFPNTIVPYLLNYSKPFINLIEPSTIDNFLGNNTGSTLPLPIEIYGDQNLSGTINIESDTVYFAKSQNGTYSLKSVNAAESPLSADSLLLTSSDKFNFLVNGYVTIQPLHDKYVQISIPENETVTIFNEKENKVAYYVANGNVTESYDISKATTSSNSSFIAIITSPTVTADGVSNFQGAFFNVPYDEVIGSGNGALRIDGKLTYNILISDEEASRSFGNYTSLDGSFQYLYPTIIQSEFPLDFLTDPGFLLSIIIILVLSIFLVSLLSSNHDFGETRRIRETQEDKRIERAEEIRFQKN